jgi:hypothetical protein
VTPPKELSSDRGTSLMAGEERRRSQRVIIRVPVMLEATMSGQKITSAAVTVAVNIHGAMVLCSRSFDAETKLEIRNERTADRTIVRVTRTPRESAEGFLIPLEFTEPSPNFWRISFPPENWKSSGF